MIMSRRTPDTDVYVIRPTHNTIDFDGLRISLSVLAQRTGTWKSHLGKVFRGRGILTLWDARNIAQELNISLDEFASKLEIHIEAQRVKEELEKEPEPPDEDDDPDEV